jgi:hypothetical protein
MVRMGRAKRRKKVRRLPGWSQRRGWREGRVKRGVVSQPWSWA